MELHDWFAGVHAGRVLSPTATEKYKEMTLRPSKRGGRSVGPAGGNGVFNAIHVTWYEARVAFTCFTNVDEFGAEKVLEPIQDVIAPLFSRRP